MQPAADLSPPRKKEQILEALIRQFEGLASSPAGGHGLRGRALQ